MAKRRIKIPGEHFGHDELVTRVVLHEDWQRTPRPTRVEHRKVKSEMIAGIREEMRLQEYHSIGAGIGAVLRGYYDLFCAIPKIIVWFFKHIGEITTAVFCLFALYLVGVVVFLMLKHGGYP